MKINKTFAVLMTTLLCTSLFTFGTYSIYTNKYKQNLSIKNDSFDVKTTITDQKTFSDGVEQTENKFISGGSWSLKNGKLNIQNIQNKDSLEFNLNVKNNKNYPCIFKIYNKCLNNYELFKNLNFNYVNNWIKLDGNKEINLSFKIDCISNFDGLSDSLMELGIKSATISDNIENLDIQEVSFDNEIIKSTPKNIYSDILLKTNNKAVSVNFPYDRLISGNEISLKVNNSSNNLFNVNKNSTCLCYDLQANGLNEGTTPLTTSLFIGRNIYGIKLHELINGEDTLNTSYNYDKDSGYLTFNSVNLNKICIEIDKEEYFIPLSDDGVVNANNLIDKINDADSNTTIRLSSGNGDYIFNENSETLIIDNKNITIVGLNGSNKVSNFNMNKPIIVSGKSILNLDNINATTDNSILLAKDNSIINVKDVNFTALKKDLSIIESIKTENGTPTVNLYDGHYKALEKNTVDSLNPLLKTDNNANSLGNGNIYVYDGEFENFNPAEVYYTKNNEIIYKSYLAEGKYCKNNDDVNYFVESLVHNTHMLNYAYRELYDFSIMGITMKYNLWLSPYLAKNNEENMYCFNCLPCTSRTYEKYDFKNFSINFAINETMLNIIKNQNTKYFMFREESKDTGLQLFGSSENHKPYINTCIYSYDGKDKIFDGYGFDLYPTPNSLSKMLFLGSGVYKDANFIRINDSSTSVILSFTAVSKEVSEKFDSKVDHTSVKWQSTSWDPNYYELVSIPQE